MKDSRFWNRCPRFDSSSLAPELLVCIYGMHVCAQCVSYNVYIVGAGYQCITVWFNPLTPLML